MDPLIALIDRWERQAQQDERIGNAVAAAERRRDAAELKGLLDDLVHHQVPYGSAPKLTGYSLGGLQNRKDVVNVGTHSNPAFRLGDLPLKRVELSPSAAWLVLSQLDRLKDPPPVSAAERRVRDMARRAA